MMKKQQRALINAAKQMKFDQEEIPLIEQ